MRRCPEDRRLEHSDAAKKPGGYLVVRSRNMKRVSRKDGVTLLWLAGKYMAAKELSGRSVLTVSRNIV